MRALAIPADDGRISAVPQAADFEQVMRRHERLVLMTALRLLGRMADAQDASQEVFLRLYRNQGKIGLDNVPAWLYRVTVNVCHDLRRRRPAEMVVEDVFVSGEASPHERTEERERQRALELSLRHLP